MNSRVVSSLIGLCALGAAGAAQAQTEPYYVTDGDASTAYRIQGGAVTTFSIPTIFYPIAVRSSLFLQHTATGDRAEYTLAGSPTGPALASTGAAAGEQLDAAATTLNSYTVNTNGTVRQFGPDFSSPTVLFSVPAGASGVTLDPTTGDFLIITAVGGDTIARYSATGSFVGSITVAGEVLRSLAYEASTDTLWAVNPTTNRVLQIDKASGAVLQTLDVGVDFDNPFGGEMTAAAPFGMSPAAVPTLSEWAMILFGAVLAGAAALTLQRRRNRFADAV